VFSKIQYLDQKLLKMIPFFCSTKKHHYFTVIWGNFEQLKKGMFPPSHFSGKFSIPYVSLEFPLPEENSIK
jgi:hypothetical protein